MTFTMTTRAGTPLVFLKGPLNETCERALEDIEAAVTAGPLVIDCDEVTYINSVGILRWMAFMSELAKRGVSVTFERCPGTFYEFSIMIPAFLGNARIVSTTVSYFCTGCDKESLVLVEAEDLAAAVARDVICIHCGAVAKPEQDYD